MVLKFPIHQNGGDVRFRTEQWIAWIGATMVAALTMAAFAFTTFETQDHAKESKADLNQGIIEIKNDMAVMRNESTKRLDRMESKIDVLLGH